MACEGLSFPIVGIFFLARGLLSTSKFKLFLLEMKSKTYIKYYMFRFSGVLIKMLVWARTKLLAIVHRKYNSMLKNTSIHKLYLVNPLNTNFYSLNPL